MPSGNVPSFTDYAGGQSPDDLVYIAKDPFGLTDDRKSTLNDLFSVITKNITDGAVRFEEFTAPAVSAAGEGALYFDDVDKTFKGSRNGSAYHDLLFGDGANQQVGVFTSTIDLLDGYPEFYYNNATYRLFLESSLVLATLLVQRTGANPAYFRAFGGQGFANLGYFAVGTAGPVWNFYRGTTGPALPTNGMDIGSLRFRPAANNNDTPTTVGGARIDVRATENAVIGTGGGVGLTIFTAANGEVSDNPRFLINYLGAVMVGVNSATITTNTGTDTKTVLGELTTYDSDAIHQIGNPSAGDAKILIIQGNASQTKALTEWQNSAGTFLFSIGAFGSHTYGGTTGIAVSPAGQGRIYFDSASNTFKWSANGSAYVDLGNGPGGTTGSIQYNTGAGAFDGDNYFLWDSASATIQIGSAGVLAGKIELRNASNSNTLTIQPGATGSNITFTLPTTDGAAGEFLQTDGLGVLSWAAASAGTLTVGTTAIASGTVGRVFYEATGNVLGQAAGITYQTGASPTVTITAQNAAYTALYVNSAPTPAADVVQVATNGTTRFRVDSNGYVYSIQRTYLDNASVYLASGSGGYAMLLSTAGGTNGWAAGYNLQYLRTGSGIIAWGDGSVFGTARNMTLSAPTSNELFIGVNSASPSAQSILINGPRGGTDSNTAGVAFNLRASKGTGTGAPGTISLQFARPGSSGSSLNTLSDSVLFNYTTDAIYQTWKLQTTTTAEQDAAAIAVGWLDNTHATRTAVLSIQVVGNAAPLAIVAEFDVPTVAGDTAFSIYDLDNATLERVSTGAADSGGTGFKVLRIPN